MSEQSKKKFPLTFGEYTFTNIVNHTDEYRIRARKNVSKRFRSSMDEVGWTDQIQRSVLGRTALKLERNGRTSTLAGLRWGGSRHKNKAHFHPCNVSTIH